MTPRSLRATYRLQLTPEFGFAAARELIPYLSELGISHLYLSPSLQARTGSTHGYDVTDPSRLSDALGGEAGFRELVDSSHAAGMGIILDVVPNHMGANDENRHWSDPELRRRFFDVDEVSGRWRRFFDIDDLAAVRVEDDEVFQATHAKVISLVTDGLVDGLRVDHPDGLTDPTGYLERLAGAGVRRVWVEKILGAEERLPEGWPVSGTVGYDFLNDLIGLAVNPAAEDTFTRLWEEIAEDRRPFGAWAFEAKLEQAHGPFAPEVERLARVSGAPGSPDVAALALALASQPVYRSYTPPTAGEFLTRFQQTSPAIMAKGVEDTAFYRYGRLLALNEVGGEPGRFALSAAAFHAHNAERALHYPEALLTTMTHDAKRSADVRARIVALTWRARDWRTFVERWLDLEPTSPLPTPDRVDRYFILQTLVGAWPLEWERIDTYLEKALREGKRRSNWIEPDTEYESGAMAWARALVDDEGFAADFERLLGPVREIGERISLGWVALKLLSPGVPDLYQGDEFEYRALVDPDNRRPVDWAARRAALRDPAAPGKFTLIRDLLALRARRPAAFGPGSSYVAREAEPGAIAFTRGGEVDIKVGLYPGPGTGIEIRELD